MSFYTGDFVGIGTLGQFGGEFYTCRATADDHHKQILARVRRKNHSAAKKVVERRRLAYAVDEVTVLQDAGRPEIVDLAAKRQE